MQTLGQNMMKRHAILLVVLLLAAGCGRAPHQPDEQADVPSGALSADIVAKLLEQETWDPPGIARVNTNLKQHGSWTCMMLPHSHDEKGAHYSIGITNDTWSIIARKVIHADDSHKLTITYEKLKR